MRKNILLLSLLMLLLGNFITTKSIAQCAVTTAPTEDCSFGDEIDNFTLNAIVAADAGCSTGGYGVFAAPVWNLTVGQTYNFSATLGLGNPFYTYQEGFSLWIDLNNNNIYESTERLANVAPSNLATGTITIPLTATIANNVHMRIRCAYNATPAAGAACTNSLGLGFGETEDFRVNILPNACSGTPTAGSVSPAGPINMCAPGVSTTLTLTGTSTGAGINISWEQSTNGGVSWTSTGITTSTYTFTPSVNVMVHAVVTCSNSGLSATSNAVTINVNPVPTITLGANPVVGLGSTFANLPYSSTTGSPTNYSITWGATALGAGFLNVSNVILPATPIVLTLPGAAPANTYTGTLTVSNGNCTSTTYPISVIILNAPTISLGTMPTICIGTTIAPLPYSSTTLSPTTYSIVWNAAALAAGYINVNNSPLPVSPININSPAGAPTGTYNGTLTVSNGTVSPNYPISVAIINTPTVTLGANPTICAGITTANLTYSASTFNPTNFNVTWNPAAISAGLINVNNAVVSGSPLAIPIPGSIAPNTYSGILTVSNICGNSVQYPFSVTVNPSTVPNISTSGSNNLCIGTITTYTAITNIVGGTLQWQVNGLNVGTNSTTYTYAPSNGDIVTCIINVPGTGCYTTPSLTSTPIGVSVSPYIVPNINITGNSTGCLGINSTYTAISNAASANYQWKVNGVNVGTNSSTYTYGPANGDQISCIVTATAGCFSPLTAPSNIILINGIPSIFPSISIQSITGTDTICDGPAATYISNTNFPGGSYQWMVNGVNVGYNSPDYNYTPANGDQITCTVTIPPTGQCFLANSANSNTRTVSVIPSIVPTVSIAPGSFVVCTNTTASYHAVTNIISGSYQWKVNNSLVGTNSSTYSYIPTDSDQIMCTVTEPTYAPSGPCYTQIAAVSPSYVINVLSVESPLISINAPTFATVGSNVTVTASLVNAGPTYTIQWFNHGVLFNTTNSPAVTYTKTSGVDSITAKVSTTAFGCTGNSTSNSILVHVGTSVNNVVKGGISVFPNPFNNNIVIKGLELNDKLCVYDLMGRKVTPIWIIDNENPEQSFKINELPAGTYLLQIWNPDGQSKESMPLIKK
ncbi:MAG: T9SS type A sorting domain-containing protein [Bacteroidota bacterium]